MNLEDYVNHIKQKYKQFIAISILKTKPDNVSIENYINILRNKLGNEIDLNSICSDDFLYKDDDEIMPDIQNGNNDTQALSEGDILADAQCFPSLERNDIQNIDTTTTKKKSNMNQCYNIQTDQVSAISQDFSNNMQENNKNTIVLNNMKNDIDKSLNDKILPDTSTQRHGHKQQDNDKSLKKLKTEKLKSNTQISNNSIDLLQDYFYYNNGIKKDKKHDPDIYQILREVDDKTQDTQLANTDKTFCESQLDIEMENAVSQTIISQDNPKPNIIDTIDSEQTELYSVHGFTQKYTYISESQTQNVNIARKYIYGSKTNELKNNEKPVTFKDNTDLTDEDLTMINDYDIFTLNQHYKESKSDITNTNNNNVSSRSDLSVTTNTDYNIDKVEKIFSNDDKCNPINNITEYERNNDHYMQDSMDVNLYIENNAKLNTKKIDSVEKINDLDTNKNHVEISMTQTHKVIKSNEGDVQANLCNNINAHDKQHCSNKEIPKYEVDTSTTKTYFEHMNIMPQNDINTAKATTQNEKNDKLQNELSAGNICAQNDNNTLNTVSLCDFYDAYFENYFNIENRTSQIHYNEKHNFSENIISQPEFNTQNLVGRNIIQNDNNEINLKKTGVMEDDVINTQNDSNNENMDVSESDTNEIVPFKIIDELNRVKSYFNRKVDMRQIRDGWIDSGYKTDSQGRYSKSSSQLSATSLNQSAHCLVNFLTNYPLSLQTNEIMNQISMALGNLLDSLHEEENYLPFLEEHLDCISSLLKSLHQEDNEEDMLLKKEELSQRIILLNKSVHIQKFTIEKIANILDETHTELRKTEAKREIENISTIENLCYVFNVLQVLLPTFLENHENNSQPSQDEKTALTRSSLSDIWRMRWSGEIKTNNSDQNVEKCSVVEKLSEILNKLVVDCMDGYSLIAYFALKCFNLLQSQK